MRGNCENRNGEILMPGCGNGKSEMKLVVLYKEDPVGDAKKAFYLCAKCAKDVSDDAKRQGYRTNYCG